MRECSRRTRSSVLALCGASSLWACGNATPVTKSLVPIDGGSDSAGGNASEIDGGANGNDDDGGALIDPGIFGDSDVPARGAALAESCSETAACRQGLVCNPTGTCGLSHAAAAGASCTFNGDCALGYACTPPGAERKCAPRATGMGGVGAKGTSCASDTDCADNLRCGLVGFAAQCIAEGTGDLRGPCATSADCAGGLVCTFAKCVPGSPGTPSFGFPTWAGEKCETESATAAPISYFRVPRGAGDKDFYRLPFPNDIRMKGGHPDLTGRPVPGSEFLGFDPVDRYLRAIEAENDGFGPYSTVLFRFNTAFDVVQTEAKNNLTYVDVTAGDPAYGTAVGNGGMQWNIDYGNNKYICPNSLAVRTLAGDTLAPGHTYALILHDITQVAGGAVPGGASVGADDDFKAMLAAAVPADAALAAAYAAYQPLRDYLAATPALAGKNVINAAVFTVGHPGKQAENLAKVVSALPAPVPTGWIKCGSGTSPCADTTLDRACDAELDPSFDELQALVPLPIFQSGSAPYFKPEEGGHISIDAPQVVRTENVCLSLTIPKGATMPTNGWPLVIYAHGTGGSYRSHIREGVAKALATVTGLNTVPFAVLGIDQVEHGPRRGASTASPNDLFYNFANPYAARDNAAQGAADQMSLAKLAASLDIESTALTGSKVKIDPGSIEFWGHSQGATCGGIMGPYVANVGALVFSGQGASLIDSLLSKTSPVNIAAALPFALSDIDAATPTQLRDGAFHPVLSLLQMYIDPADPLTHAGRLTPEGSGGHHVLQVYGQKDTYSTPITQLTFALAVNPSSYPRGLGVLAHDPAITTPDFPDYLHEAEGALHANLFGRLTGVVRQYAKPVDADGHFVAFKNPLAQRDIYRFLDEASQGIAPTVSP